MRDLVMVTVAVLASIVTSASVVLLLNMYGTNMGEMCHTICGVF